MPGPTSLVTLTDLKPHLNIPTADVSHDTELQGFIDDTQAIIEDIVGPVVQVTRDEWYDGGCTWIALQYRPIVSVTSVVEYWANAAYTLAAVTDPSAATAYSYQLDGGRIIRRSPRGAVSFAEGTGNVHVVYVAGRTTVPANVRLATLELIRHNYQLSQQGGRPTFGGGALEEAIGYSPSGFAVPTRVVELLAPNRRFPSIQ